MANKPIQMSKLRQALKLYFQGESKLRISALTGISRNTLKKYLSILTAYKTSWSDIELLDDKQLDELFCKEPEKIVDERLSTLHEYFTNHDKRLRKRGMTLLRLWDEYRLQYPEGFATTSFYHYYNLWKRRAKPSMHMEHTAGEKIFVDFTGQKLNIVDTETGEIKDVEVFVAVLGASQYTYVEAVESQKVEDFIGCCENALRFYGGSPNIIVPDNLKAAVTKSSRYEPKLNENFEAFADHYNMVVLPARAYKPKDKSLVEGAVKITYMKIFATLSDTPCTSLEELNEQIRLRLEEYNSTNMKGRPYSRKDQFNEIEKATLQELPENHYELRRSLNVTVAKNSHVCLSADRHYYSVPFSFIHKKVKVLYSKSQVQVYYKYDLIATHKRIRSPYNYTTELTHLASQHQILTDWNPEFFLQRAREVSPDVEYYIDQVLRKKQVPEQAYKSCQGILSFAKRIGHERLTKACQRAHAYGLYHFRAIEEILKKGLDLHDLEQEQQLSMPLHENIRGKDYYQ